MTHMTQNMRQLIALIPYSPVTQKAPMRTTKIMLMALHQSEITNFPMTRAIRSAISMIFVVLMGAFCVDSV